VIESIFSRSIFILILLVVAWPVNLALAAEDRPRVVMLGDSLTAGFNWAAHLPQAVVDNQGISGDTTKQIRARLDKVIEAKPDLIFLQAGINDLGGQRREGAIMEGHWAIWKTLKSELPGVRIHLISLLPVSERRYPGWNRKIEDLNHLLRNAAEGQGFAFIDLFPLLIDQGGQLAPKYTYDGLHLTAEGYAVWLGALKPYLPPVTR
jgi:Lysophospholipase L1 and related esterases